MALVQPPFREDGVQGRLFGHVGGVWRSLCLVWRLEGSGQNVHAMATCLAARGISEVLGLGGRTSDVPAIAHALASAGVRGRGAPRRSPGAGGRDLKGRNPVALSNSTPWTLPVRTAGLKGGTALSPGPSSLVQRIRRGIAGKLRPTIRSGISPPQPLTDPGFRERKSRRSPSTHLPIRWEGRPGLSRRRSQGTISGRQVA
eukprot:scaffold633_cov321-Pavlova_lutheri.AAC.39